MNRSTTCCSVVLIGRHDAVFAERRFGTPGTVLGESIERIALR